MFAKPINLILVYIVTIFNITILASPMVAMLVPLIDRHTATLTITPDMMAKIKLAIFILLFLVSFLMLIYFILDFLFGFAMRASLKGCQRYEKVKDYDFLSKIFEEVKDKFGEKSVKLYIKQSDEINAFAVSSLGGKAIVLTSGIVDHYLAGSNDPKEFLYALRSIMGHEMSHLINKDFLPTFLIMANQKITNLVSYVLGIIFNFVSRGVAMMPYGGRVSSRLMFEVYIGLNFVLNAFNRFVVYNLYEFLRRFVSRSIEYRCDKQSGEAFGGKNMAFALSFLGESGYFTLFSTHPQTKKRIAAVQNVEIVDEIIRPRFIDGLSNYFAMMFLMIVCLYFAKHGHIDLYLREYIRDHEVINQKLSLLWRLVSRFF